MTRFLATTMAIWIGATSAPAGAQVWEVGGRYLTAAGGPGPSVEFGHALAVGDFDDDGYDDLAIGRPGADKVEVYRGSALGLGTTPWLETTLPAGSQAGAALATGDFDGDGRDELAVGMPGYDILADTSYYDIGAVQVIELVSGYWTWTTPLRQGSGGTPGAAESYDRFASTLAVGDFNGDGYDDLAIGVPSEAVGAKGQAGAVNEVRGGPSGLNPADAAIWYRDGGGINGVAAVDAILGQALAAGDFDSDGVDDLAIGIPGEMIDAIGSTGQVTVLFGVEDYGLGSSAQQVFDPTDFGETAAGQGFGAALAAADFNTSFACLFAGTCAVDLAIGAPGQVVSWNGGSVGGAGRVFVAPGVDGVGLTTANSFAIDQGDLDPLAATAPETFDGFGSALAAGHLDHEFGAELIVGTPREDAESVESTGCAHLLFAPSPFTSAEPQYLYARTGLGTGSPLADDELGASLAAGDFDGDGWNDLAIGLPGRTVGGQARAGAVQILFGALFADGFEHGSPSGWSGGTF